MWLPLPGKIHQGWMKIWPGTIRSINGTVGSAASCKTLSLKYNQLISLFIKGMFIHKYPLTASMLKLLIYLLS
jgi:hypothetical protein